MIYQNILDRLNHSISARYAKPLGFARRLAPLLNVTTDTIYNKLSGRTRLTVEELFIIIHELRIPLSEIMEENPLAEIHPLELRVYDNIQSDGFTGMFDWYHETIAAASASENSRFMLLCSNIPEFSFVDLKFVSAFSKQKWLFYHKGLETVPPLSEILDDNTNQEKYRQFIDSFRNIKTIEYILGIDITRNYVLDLVMFYEYNLITKEEACHILDDLYQLLHTFERICTEGVVPGSGNTINIYYHSTQMYGNNLQLIDTDHLNLGLIHSHFGHPIIAHHSKTLDLIRSWYHTWKRSSVAITQAGLKNRLYFINEQKKAFDYARAILQI